MLGVIYFRHPKFSSFIDSGRSVCFSAICRKGIKLPLSSKEKLLKKSVILKWNTTDKRFFGPIFEKSYIKNKDKKCDAYSSESKVSSINHIKGSSKLLPVGLWGCRELFENHVRRRQSQSKRAFETSISTGEKSLTNEEEHVSKTQLPFNGVIPNQPFILKDNLILPFPMLVGKQSTKKELTPKKISSLPSPEEALPSVTQILRDTVSKETETVLELWRKRKISEVGEEGLKEYMRNAVSIGKQLHTCIETRLRGVDYDAVHVEPRISGHWLSLKEILVDVEDVQVLESCVVHPQLKYKGFVDCVARYKGHLVVIEWKTSQRIKNNLKQAYDDPVQMAAYIGALNADSSYAFEVENALLVVAYPTGRPADIMMLDGKKCEKYWFEWLKRLEKFNLLKSRKDESIHMANTN